MAEQKYFTEVALDLCTKGVAMLRSSDIQNVPAETDIATFLADCHIYLICRRPRITLIAESIQFTEQGCSGELCFHSQGQKLIRKFKMSRGYFHPLITQVIASDYPHTKLLTKTQDDKIIHTMPVTLIAHTLEGNFDHFLDLEVVYVGQAYGEDGSRSALERLREHSTLQKIQADTITHTPDNEIFVLLFQYADPLLQLQMDGRGDPKIIGDEDDTHWQSILDNPLPDAALVTIAEAGLIRYFQPHYNLVYKDSFPSSRIKSLQQCYDFDFWALAVEIDTEDINTPIYSANRPTIYHHIATFDLHDQTDRRKFFALES